MTCSKTNPCYGCGRQPQIQQVYDLWYVSCTQCQHIEVNPSLNRAIENWNENNPTKRKITFKPKTDDVRDVSPLYGKVYPIYELDEEGNKVKKYDSLGSLAKALNLTPLGISVKFTASRNDVITIRGKNYARYRAEATPAKNSGMCVRKVCKKRKVRTSSSGSSVR